MKINDLRPSTMLRRVEDNVATIGGMLYGGFIFLGSEIASDVKRVNRRILTIRANNAAKRIWRDSEFIAKYNESVHRDEQ